MLRECQHFFATTAQKHLDNSDVVAYYSNATKCEEVTKMLTKNEQKTIERLATVMQSMDDLQKAQLCAFAEGLAMALEHSKRAS